MSFMVWVLMWSMFKWIKIDCIRNEAGWSGFYVRVGTVGVG